MDKSIPVGAALLLNFIYRTDAGQPPPKCYDTIFSNRQDHLPKPLTSMTIGEVIDAQKNWSNRDWVRANWKVGPAVSSAAGAAQFMRDTLVGLSKELGLSGGQLFDANLQDRLAYQLLKRRGIDDYLAGKIDATEFGKRLAMEWASFPVLAACQGASRNLKRGQSFYAGDGLNKALVAPETIEEVLLAVRKAPDKATQPPQPPPAPEQPPPPQPQSPSAAAPAAIPDLNPTWPPVPSGPSSPLVAFGTLVKTLIRGVFS